MKVIPREASEIASMVVGVGMTRKGANMLKGVNEELVVVKNIKGNDATCQGLTAFPLLGDEIERQWQEAKVDEGFVVAMLQTQTIARTGENVSKRNAHEG
jgi:hypothetical protein